MEIDFNFIKRDLESSMASDGPPTSVFNPQKELSQRARAMRADVGKASADGDVFDRELAKLFAGEIPLTKGPARLADGHRWPEGYKPTEELLAEPPQLFARIVERNPGTRDFVARFENFLTEFSAA